MNHPDVTIVIVSWNTREILRDCLKSVSENAGAVACQTIVVDNASTDGSAEMVTRGFADVQVVANPDNRGFAAANNQGMALARGRYVLLLNSDTIVLDGAIEKTVMFADAHPEAAVVGCRVLNPDRSLQASCFMFPSVLNMVLSSTYLYKLLPRSRFFGRERMTWWDKRDPRAVDVISGCFMLVRREALEQVGPMDEGFFMYAEETDWCYRFKKAGWQNLYTPDGQIVHLGGQSTARVSVPMTVQMRLSILRFIRKHRSSATYWTCCVLVSLFFLVRVPIWLFLWAFVGGSRSRSRAKLQAYLSGAVRVFRDPGQVRKSMVMGMSEQACATQGSGSDVQTTAEMTYTVVTPAYNEQTNLPATIASMAAQTLKPQVWVIVDDGSADDTWRIIREASEAHPWIVGLRREKKQAAGTDGLLVASEAVAFLEGYRLAVTQSPASAFVVKLDADLEFGPEYFAALLDEFRHNPKLGIAGGVIYEYRGTELVREKVSKAHVRGATKVYRRACYQEIHGVRPVFGWDVIDEIEARSHGWDVHSFNHLRLVHLRRTASRGGRFAGWARNGYMAYYIGMSPLRMFARAASRLLATGDVIQSSGLAYGYFSNLLKRADRLPDPDIRRLVQKHQWVTLGAYVKPSSVKPHIKEPANE